MLSDLSQASGRHDIAFLQLDVFEIDASENRLQFTWWDGEMLAVAGSQRSLKATTFQSLHPDRQSVAVPIHDLDTIATQVEEDKQAAVADIACQVLLDDSKESIKALSHIDWLGV